MVKVRNNITTVEIKMLISIEQVLLSLYGIEIKGVSDCPIHGGDKCFSVRGDYFKCFSCGASGDIFQLVQALSNVDFIEAKNIICEYFGLSASQGNYREKIKQIKREQKLKRLLKSIRRYQEDRICQVLREIRTADGDSFLESHLESLLRRFEKKKDFYIEHDIHAHLLAILHKAQKNIKNKENIWQSELKREQAGWNLSNIERKYSSS